MENAIKIAIENGYDAEKRFYGESDWYKNMCKSSGIKYKQNNLFKLLAVHIDTFVLDPLFWQALGKGLGWKVKEELGKSHDTVMLNTKGNIISEWQYAMHRFIDHLALNKDIDSFFKSLITK